MAGPCEVRALPTPLTLTVSRAENGLSDITIRYGATFIMSRTRGLKHLISTANLHCNEISLSRID